MTCHMSHVWRRRAAAAIPLRDGKSKLAVGVRRRRGAPPTLRATVRNIMADNVCCMRSGYGRQRLAGLAWAGQKRPQWIIPQKKKNAAARVACQKGKGGQHPGLGEPSYRVGQAKAARTLTGTIAAGQKAGRGGHTTQPLGILVSPILPDD